MVLTDFLIHITILNRGDSLPDCGVMHLIVHGAQRVGLVAVLQRGLAVDAGAVEHDDGRLTGRGGVHDRIHARTD